MVLAGQLRNHGVQREEKAQVVPVVVALQE
jgi:hypothetical protein